MDFNSLKDTVSNLSLYDLKASVRKVQNGSSSFLRPTMPSYANRVVLAVMNYTEMEAKVREATNNEPYAMPMWKYSFCWLIHL